MHRTSRTCANTPPANTPIPPDETIRRFARNYNERNASMLYSLFSERVRANYTLEDVEECLKLAEANGVKIVEWEIGEERFLINYSFPQKRVLNVSLTLQWNGKTCNVTFELPMVVKEDYLIDEWIFKEFEFIFESTSGDSSSRKE